jgi:hypothetical protein
MRCAICDAELTEADFKASLAAFAENGRRYDDLCASDIASIEALLEEDTPPQVDQ